MFKELIAECAKDIRYVRIQEPASIEEIRAAERSIGCNFPQELVNLLLECNGDRWLLFSVDEITGTVTSLREAMAEDYADMDKHLFFGGNGCGDYYCYAILPDGTADGTSIYLWEHETNESHKVASDMAELIRRYYNNEI